MTRNCNLDYNKIDKIGVEPKVFFDKNMNEIINKINSLNKELKLKTKKLNSTIDLNLRYNIIKKRFK